MNNREIGDYEAIERASKVLQKDETLYYCERPPASDFGLSVFCMILGGLWGIAFVAAAIGMYMDNSIDVREIPIFAGLSLIGWFLLYVGCARVFIVNKLNFNFVSNQRLCVRGKGVFGKPYDRDFPLPSIEKVYLKRVRSTTSHKITHIVVETKDSSKYPFTFYPWNINKMMPALETAVERSKNL